MTNISLDSLLFFWQATTAFKDRLGLRKGTKYTVSIRNRKDAIDENNTLDQSNPEYEHGFSGVCRRAALCLPL